jgi:hypothetical protein
MSRRPLPLSILAASLLFCEVFPVLAQNATPAPPVPPPVQKPFSFGDLMDTLVQPRHVKLALAGRAQNWVLAAYALTSSRTHLGMLRYRDHGFAISQCRN